MQREPLTDGGLQAVKIGRFWVVHGASPSANAQRSINIATYDDWIEDMLDELGGRSLGAISSRSSAPRLAVL